MFCHPNTRNRGRLDNIYHTTSDEIHLGAWHDDVIKWKPFPRYWPSVRVIHKSQ